MEEILDKLKKTQLDILKDIILITEKNNLEYFLIAGTLIGSVRHEGFIPWDDDIDIAMTRSDYNKFKKIIMKDYSEKYFFQDFDTEDNYYQSFGKMRLNNTLYDEESASHLDIHKGIFVDIFVLDYLVANRGFIYDLKSKLINLLKTMISYKYIVEGSNKKTSKEKFKLLMLKMFPNRFLKKLLIDLMKLNNNSVNKKYLVNYACQYGYKKQTYLIEDYFPPSIGKFENTSVKIPQNYDKILKKIYGDYMKIPSVENRITHSPSKIKFLDK